MLHGLCLRANLLLGAGARDATGVVRPRRSAARLHVEHDLALISATLRDHLSSVVTLNDLLVAHRIAVVRNADLLCFALRAVARSQCHHSFDRWQLRLVVLVEDVRRAVLSHVSCDQVLVVLVDQVRRLRH